MPRMTDVTITAAEDGFTVGPRWADVDRPYTGGYLVRTEALALRLRAAMLAGVVYYDAEVRTDIHGQTYVAKSSRVLGRTANADLRRLGF